jgi:hypothetical protein
MFGREQKLPVERQGTAIVEVMRNARFPDGEQG